MPNSSTAPDPALPASTRVLIVGAGQAGLSAAYHLQRRGLTAGRDLVIVDRGPKTGGAWQFRWESLRLGTAHRVNDLPGMGELGLSFETADQSQAARDVVAEYYARYEQHFGLHVFRPVEVRTVRDAHVEAGAVRYAPVEVRAEHDARGAGTVGGDAVGGDRVGADTAGGRASLLVGTSAGDIRTEIVVNASGTWATPVRPYYPGVDTFAGRQLATPEYRSATEFAGKRVVVVGGGTSAVGFLLELEGVAASTLWVTRRPVVFGDPVIEPAPPASSTPQSTAATPPATAVGLESRLAAVAAQDAAAREGRVLPSIISGTGLPATPANLAGEARGVLVARPVFTSVEPDGVRFADGSFEPADAIIWATGFRSELRHLDPLNLRETGGGVRVEKGRVARDGRVFLAGYGPQASTIGANRAGRLVAVQVLDALRQLEHPETA
ncbi:FAD-dependent oxidoreductase [Subtercola sp. YIM 133946]|uniref:FAD-dependent oxidoreductase n=1 Tax=Subtercola sp. YIM 133946 TaxID=3118909 RepID=UPI002F94FA24